MNELDGLMAPPDSGITLNDFIADPITKLPLSAARNRAASTALLSGDPSTAIDNYRLMMREAEDGKDNVQKQLAARVTSNVNKLDLKGVMGVLSDPKIPYEQKQKALSQFKGSALLNDDNTTLLTNSLTAASQGEPPPQEDARINTVDSIREIYQSWEDVQGIQNAHAAGLDDVSGSTFFGMLEAWVMPFGNNIAAGKMAIAQAEKEGRKLSTWDKMKLYMLPGKATASLSEGLARVPPEKRVEFAKSLVDTISGHSGIIFSNKNQFVQFDKASAILEKGGYGSFQEFVDNVSPLLDVIGVGQLFRKGTKVTKVTKPGTTAANAGIPPTTPPYVSTSRELSTDRVIPATWEVVDDSPKAMPESHRLGKRQERIGMVDTIKRIEMNGVVRSENPSSPASVIAQGNPSQARSLHEAIVEATDDELASAMHGTTREQALANNIAPQVATESGAVVSKVPNIEKSVLDKVVESFSDMIDMIGNTGAIYFTRGEKAVARAAVVHDFRNAEGLTINDAMSSFVVDGGKIKINAVYGLEEGSWLRAETALAQTRLALNRYGILDEEIELLRKEGLDHVPVRLEDVKDLDGNYLIRIKTAHEIDPTDVGNLAGWNVKRNLFDRVSPWLGKFITDPARWVFDAASMLHPGITGPAVVAADKASKLEHYLIQLADQFAGKIKPFDKARKAKIDDYIREANYNGVAFDRTDLMARGFTSEEIDSLKSWRDFWDAHYYLENYDVIRTLNSQGYQLFKNQNTELYARPVAKNQNITNVYDPAQDAVVIHAKADGDALYNANGTYARLRRPTDFNGVTTEYMIVRNTPTEYLRNFRHTDTVLNYRHGYFQIHYDAPKFVDEIVRDAKGVEIGRKAIAVAGDTAEAQGFAERTAMAAGKSINDYKVRGDVRAMQRGGDDWWDLNGAQGRIAQRHRGKLLEDSSGLNHLGDGSYIVSPVDSAIRSARSIAGRTISRPMIEAAKARAIAQYGDMFPSNGIGGKRWPNSLDEIGAKGEPTSKRVADARTTFAYVNYLENGYINNVDAAIKATFNMLAEITGKQGLSKIERGLIKVGESNLPSLAKNSVFMAYVGSNVLRQWIVQAHQVVRTFSYNPIGWANGNIEKYLAEFLGETSGLTKETEFTKFIKGTGLLDSVDKQSLVRGALMDASDASNPGVKAIKKTTGFVRRIGFDAGEIGNLLGHAAAVYDKYKRAGLNVLTKEVADEMHSEIRALSYDMNFAGDMPYNQTSASVLLQFMQVPHKALLQMTNRRLPWQMRARLVAADMVVWGPPSLLVGAIMGHDYLPDNPKMREIYLNGVESMLLNNMFNELFEDNTNIDFTSLDPYGMSGWKKFFQAMYSGGMKDMLLNSPAGQIFVKDQGRTQNAIAAMQRYFAGFIDSEQPPESFIGMMTEIAKITSGFSSAHKASMLLDAKQRYDQFGKTVDKSVNHVEAWAQLFGFGTADTRDLYEISQKVNTRNKEYKDEVLNVYKTMKQYYEKELQNGNKDPKFITAISGFVLNRYKDEPVAIQIIANEIERDAADPNSTLLYQMMKASQIPDHAGLRKEVEISPLTPDEKREMLRRLDDASKAKTKKD